MKKWFDEKLERRNLRRNSNEIEEKSRKMNVNRILRRLSITNWLIIINIIIYLLVVILKVVGFPESSIFSVFALSANTLFSGAVWTLLTSMFTHFWLPHLLFNLISLFFVGNFLERIIGRKKFLWFYLISGIFAGIFYSVLSFYFGTSELGERIFINPSIPSVGASGAIFGLAGLLAIITPFMRVYLIAGPIFALILQSSLSTIVNPQILSLINFFIAFYIFLSIFSMFSFNPVLRKIGLPISMPFWILPIVAIVPLVIIGLFVELPIGNTAHLGGLIAGFAYGSYLRIKYKRKTQLLQNYFR